MPPPNLVVNPNFNSLLSGWNYDGNTSYYNNPKVAVFDIAGNTGGGSIWQEIEVKPGKTYDFSFLYGLAVNEVSGGSANISYEIITVPDAGSTTPPVVLLSGSGSDTTGTQYSNNNPPSKPYAADTSAAGQITIPAGITKIRITISGNVSATDKRDVVVDDVSLTKVVCFTRGTLIGTDAGERPVETLRKGDLVRTLHSGLQPIRWIGRRRLTSADLAKQPKLRPILIRKDALGSGVPATDLIVSPQHRMLVSSTIVHRVFGENVVLVSAKQLLPLDGVSVIEDEHPVEYWHFLCDDHQIVTANGAMAETLLLGQEALKTLSGDALDEIRTIFPELDLQDTAIPAATIARGPRCRQMVARHLKNRKALVQHLSLPGDNLNAPVAVKAKERA
ncbi:Hint domain-containing protein [Paracoccus sp. SCSIO 75233]|uniref:Hint domain-containing protein n=1 Tax=Paracoccus sp. SCSIO 75233 TaxID=3017782 RepID=UPI0022F0F4F8|nr:Hint domain-containing protein [Paracoccus sp. SCSIO 75233]WBU53206.1 Hint domain-containing protein [Paracoccus sp. SCSIO 75233]